MDKNTANDRSTASIWRDTFTNWPAQFRRKGVAIPTLGEPIPFSEFLVNNDVIVFERATPDNTGARRVCIPFQNIAALKYTEPLKTEQFLQAGYIPGVNVPPPKPANKKVPIVDAAPAASKAAPQAGGQPTPDAAKPAQNPQPGAQPAPPPEPAPAQPSEPQLTEQQKSEQEFAKKQRQEELRLARLKLEELQRAKQQQFAEKQLEQKNIAIPPPPEPQAAPQAPPTAAS